jgi:2C-methyl-D-erythritol 2,4-cyclodiphosphate synthase
MTLITEARNESTALLIKLWKRISSKIHSIFNAAVKIAQQNPILSEYILKDILKNYKHSIQQIGLDFSETKEEKQAHQ